MTHSLFGQLEGSLREYLDDIEDLAGDPDDERAAEVARTELPRVIAALRSLLEEHRPGPDGRCRACRPRLISRPPSPCRAYLTAHLCLRLTKEEAAQKLRAG
ncbi:hypothetical protein EV193_10962 [Herbihabitans rhizosphaerae]|uniref:Uncharacterized protein n=1 Tax=Herbihabitans rhizosphaerae TaxID=1872711 RepID=A0A4Q7KJ66_9PSEU|nr:hypothetical protein [Herbihabitans rhizosphaerae]RZS34275.1 hypothetical protein EV193_10962 [Herbihabitans rhizosphaerae]